jgi:hypothetical protein
MKYNGNVHRIRTNRTNSKFENLSYKQGNYSASLNIEIVQTTTKREHYMNTLEKVYV